MEDKGYKQQHEGLSDCNKAIKWNTIKNKSKFKCYNCKKKGPFAFEYPSGKQVNPHSNSHEIQEGCSFLTKTSLNF